uniref:Uncharacterized protein n=1 Tax=Caenorhabditis japonica TaxID=281687 RepID=A0A8R1ERT7_CAEJA
MNAQQSEYNVLVNWLELVAALPWSTSTVDDIEISKVNKSRKLLQQTTTTTTIIFSSPEQFYRILMKRCMM